jgi:hypothetical protein
MADMAVQRVRESQAAVLREIENVQERTMQLKHHLEDCCESD